MLRRILFMAFISFVCAQTTPTTNSTVAADSIPSRNHIEEDDGVQNLNEPNVS